MTIEVKTIQSTDAKAWDEYVYAHRDATLYHLYGWRNVIEKTYGHKTYYLLATENSQQPASGNQHPETSIHRQERNYESSAISHDLNSDNIVGILPLVHLKNLLFTNSLISIPFFDLGGILANDGKAEQTLLSQSIKLAQKLKVNNMELRHIKPLPWLVDSSQVAAHTPLACPACPVECEAYSSGVGRNCCTGVESGGYSIGELSATRFAFQTPSHKVRMLLRLSRSSEILMTSFKSKLRSQIKKPLKEGLIPKIGSVELLDDFYRVFSTNMRDLGSPVHSSNLMLNVLTELPETAKIAVVYKDSQPLAGSMVVGFKDILENPWASALREYSSLSPNMLLYWTMLEYACDNGYTYFDFGRCSPEGGTFRFKKQWGAIPTTLHWHYISLNGEPVDTETFAKSKFEKAISYWKELPVPLTRAIGPMIRKHIGL